MKYVSPCASLWVRSKLDKSAQKFLLLFDGDFRGAAGAGYGEAIKNFLRKRTGLEAGFLEIEAVLVMLTVACQIGFVAEAKNTGASADGYLAGDLNGHTQGVSRNRVP